MIILFLQLNSHRAENYHRELQPQSEHPTLQYQDDTQKMSLDIPFTGNEGNHSGESGQENRSSRDGYIYPELTGVKL